MVYIDSITSTNNHDPNNSEARRDWIRMNHILQMITFYIKIFVNVVLFATMLCWVAFASVIVISYDKVRCLYIYMHMKSSLYMRFTTYAVLSHAYDS